MTCTTPPHPTRPDPARGVQRRPLAHACLLLGSLAWLLCATSAPGWSAPRQHGAEPPAAASAAPPSAERAAPPAASAAPAAAEHAAQEPAVAEAHGKQAEAGHAEGEGEAKHGESIWAAIARLVNFVILAGLLIYLLRSPIIGYLEQRGVQVRSELVRAAELRKDASAQIEQIDARMQALPAEIEALKHRGAEEIAAEEARIQALAQSERKRLLEQATREIDTELRVAQRELKRRAAELAVGVATERVARTITDRDQARLVERYVVQVRQ